MAMPAMQAVSRRPCRSPKLTPVDHFARLREPLLTRFAIGRAMLVSWFRSSQYHRYRDHPNFRIGTLRSPRGQGMAEPVSQEQVFAKCAGRLIPFLMLLYFFNYLDRVNVGFAAL